ncbi:MAG: LPS export ABC transporter permease LptF [Hylemonella sp.]|nr:LPS export ABC transporter permease LptF [Hylemonella sp.]
MLFHSTIRKELARSFGATLIVLVTVVMTMTLIRTLGMASRGSFNPSDVMLVMSFHVLTFMPNIMAMGLFVSTMATLTRIYTDSEMVIWFNSGMGLGHLVSPLLRFAWPILLAIAGLALFVLPWSNLKIEEMRARYESRGDLERVQPGQFQESGGGSRVFFIEKGLLNQKIASNVFIATTGDNKETVTSARRGEIRFIDGDRFLVLENGQRMEMASDMSDLKLSEFSEYGILVDQDPLAHQPDLPLGARPTLDLLRRPSAEHWGEISWRIGFALAAFNLLIISVAASKINPRVGRSGNFVFALLVFQIYLNFLTMGQNWIGNAKVGFVPFMLMLHGGILVASLVWLLKRHYNWRWREAIRQAFTQAFGASR